MNKMHNVSQDFLMQLSPMQITVIKDSLEYIKDLNIAQKHILYFDNIIKKNHYYYNDLENILSEIINRYKPCLELGKFLYLISLINSGIVSWLLSTTIWNDTIRYNHYYYLCIACILLGEKYTNLNESFQKDLLFNYFVICSSNIKHYSKNINYNLKRFINLFNDIAIKWHLDSTFNKQLNKYISGALIPN